MNKKKWLAGLIMGLALSMLGCVARSSACVHLPKSMFVMVENNEDHFFDVVYHKDTKVMYSVSDGQYNRGILTVLVDADGKPMLWED